MKTWGSGFRTYRNLLQLEKDCWYGQSFLWSSAWELAVEQINHLADARVAGWHAHVKFRRPRSAKVTGWHAGSGAEAPRHRVPLCFPQDPCYWNGAVRTYKDGSVTQHLARRWVVTEPYLVPWKWGGRKMELTERYTGKGNSQVLEKCWNTHYQFSTLSVENSTLRVVSIRRST